MKKVDKRFQNILVTGAPDAQEQVSDYELIVMAKMALRGASGDGIISMPEFKVVRKVTA